MSVNISRDDVTIFPLSAKHNRASFNCTNHDLNDFLKNDAIENQEQMVSRTYVCFYEKQLVGFYTLTTDIIEVKHIEATHRWDGYKHKKYPAIKLARLSVDSRFERKGIGRLLLFAAVGIALNVSEYVGCRYITVEAKQEAIEFYEKHGFIIVEKTRTKNEPTLYLNIPATVGMMQPAESLDMLD